MLMQERSNKMVLNLVQLEFIQFQLIQFSDFHRIVLSEMIF